MDKMYMLILASTDLWRYDNLAAANSNEKQNSFSYCGNKSILW